MKSLIKSFLFKFPLFQRMDKLLKKQGQYPAGHYYSPIPDEEEIQLYLNSLEHKNIHLPDIDLNKDSQHGLLQSFSQYYKDLPFSEQKQSCYRYYYDQPWFRHADAIFLYCFLIKNKPQRIIEVGSGFSSAVILDTIDSMPNYRPEITFIEPYPNRLMSLMKKSDKEKVIVLEKKVQDVPTESLATLSSGDLLYVDSSHVVKCGSDLQFLFFEILPRMHSGVFVHFHDIFFPFEYPRDWLKQGRYWNEDYFLRAFLAYNNKWSIYFFNNYVVSTFNAYIEANMPLCLKDPGGSIYIQKN